MNTDEWQMPQPAIGDTVLFSKDYHNFSSPTVGWVMSAPRDRTVTVITFTETGYSMVYHSCHHKDDPRLKGDHAWEDLGVWDFAPSTAAIRELTEPATRPTRGSKSS
jgi:hypothetical protein